MADHEAAVTGVGLADAIGQVRSELEKQLGLARHPRLLSCPAR